MQKFSTTYLEHILAKKQTQFEQERQKLLIAIIHWLNQFGDQYGIEKAYIFGSITRPNQFTNQSDVDIAVEINNMEHFFSIIGWLSELTGREVDLLPLKSCHFAHRIYTQGMLWTPNS